ncbi:MAG: isoprenylcysteine carboxylmethyltransferase family protein [Balneola sp.]
MRLKIPPVLVFGVTALLMWVISNQISMEILEFSVNRWIVYSLGSIGVILGILGVVQFSVSKTTVNPHKPENSSSVVKNGVYKYTRNPMYFGLLIVLIACAMYFGSGYSFLMIPIFIWYMNTYQIKPEEEILIQLFGDEYKEYQQKVRRWI